MKKKQQFEDNNLGLNPWQDFVIREFVGKGKIGKVYKAISSVDDQNVLACKIIPPDNLKDGWGNELTKLSRLRGIPNVVSYYHHGTGFDKKNKPFVFVMYQFVDGWNLNEYIKEFGILDLSMIEQLTETIAKVLFACQKVNIFHGDLHAGNIMISRPDSRIVGSPKSFWITDFGYGGSHNKLKPKDDLKQLFSLLSELLKKLNRSELNVRDRIVFDKIIELRNTKILERDATQGRFAGLESMIYELEDIAKNAEIKVAMEKNGEISYSPGDYLFAEALGYNKDEWQILFVPEILGLKDLLSKNITVLTGARGCGKTMTFRRMTAYMDALIGESSGVLGADKFIGFYLNCREIVDAFPYLPTSTKVPINDQIIHFFHLLWFAEICKTLAIRKDDNAKHDWLNNFTNKFFESYTSPPEGTNILSYIRSFIENRKEQCRLIGLGRKNGLKNWPLSRMDFLDLIVKEVHENEVWVIKRPFYFFLDDYTLPTITRQTQRILNQIIFKRRSGIFFKISTESANSFELKGVRDKPLELTQDFELIDMANESLHLSKKSKKDLLNKIFVPRINRHHILKDQNLDLISILGKTVFSNNALALQMREASQVGKQKRLTYQGIDTFVGMWSSDTRTMIQMFVDILKEAENDVSELSSFLPVKSSIQDRIYRSAGGEFLKFMESATNPMKWEENNSQTSQKLGGKFGIHLKDIVEAFVNVSRYEMTRGKLISNQDRRLPKQAFRIEILDKFELSLESEPYYNGLTRWHIFLQDWRGKSVRGMLTPRLFINRLLVPYTNLTFSSHDSISVSNDEFILLLTEPKKFYSYWKDKRRKGVPSTGGPNLFNQNSSK